MPEPRGRKSLKANKKSQMKALWNFKLGSRIILSISNLSMYSFPVSRKLVASMKEIFANSKKNRVSAADLLLHNLLTKEYHSFTQVGLIKACLSVCVLPVHFHFQRNCINFKNGLMLKIIPNLWIIAKPVLAQASTSILVHQDAGHDVEGELNYSF